jgi:hypothetical protein
MAKRLRHGFRNVSDVSIYFMSCVSASKATHEEHCVPGRKAACVVGNLACRRILSSPSGGRKSDGDIWDGEQNTRQCLAEKQSGFSIFKVGAHCRFMLVPQERVSSTTTLWIGNWGTGFPRACQNTVNNSFPLRQKGMSSAQALCTTMSIFIDHSKSTLDRKSCEMIGHSPPVKKSKVISGPEGL